MTQNVRADGQTFAVFQMASSWNMYTCNITQLRDLPWTLKSNPKIKADLS